MPRKKKPGHEPSSPRSNDEEDEDASTIVDDDNDCVDHDQVETEQLDECNVCGIRHKRLDDLIAKIGFLIHAVLMVSEWYRNRETWWLNFGSAVCYAALIYGINTRKWPFYLPYFLINPLLVTILVVQILSSSYSLRASPYNDESWLSALFNFLLLCAIVLFIVAAHVVSALVILRRFGPFVTLVERRLNEARRRRRHRRDLDGYEVNEEAAYYDDDDVESTTRQSLPSILQHSAHTIRSLFRSADEQNESNDSEPNRRPPRVSWAERTLTFFYPTAVVDDLKHDNSTIITTPPPINLSQPYHPASPRVARSSVV